MPYDLTVSGVPFWHTAPLTEKHRPGPDGVEREQSCGIVRGDRSSARDLTGTLESASERAPHGLPCHTKWGTWEWLTRHHERTCQALYRRRKYERRCREGQHGQTLATHGYASVRLRLVRSERHQNACLTGVGKEAYGRCGAVEPEYFVIRLFDCGHMASWSRAKLGLGCFREHTPR
jgi:hypothetical protein